MHDGTAPPHHQSGLQSHERYPDPVNSTSTFHQGTSGIQAENPSGLPVQLRPLHHAVRDIEQATKLYPPIQLRMGILVLSGGQHRDDCHEHAVQLGVDAEDIQASILLGRFDVGPDAGRSTQRAPRLQSGSNGVGQSPAITTSKSNNWRASQVLLATIEISQERQCHQHGAKRDFGKVLDQYKWRFSQRTRTQGRNVSLFELQQ